MASHKITGWLWSKVDMLSSKELLAVYYKDKPTASSSAEEGRQISLWALIRILSPKSFRIKILTHCSLLSERCGSGLWKISTLPFKTVSKNRIIQYAYRRKKCQRFSKSMIRLCWRRKWWIWAFWSISCTYIHFTSALMWSQRSSKCFTMFWEFHKIKKSSCKKFI